MHFPSVSDFPPISGKFVGLRRKFSHFHLFQKDFFNFQTAKISADLFWSLTHTMHIGLLDAPGVECFWYVKNIPNENLPCLIDSLTFICMSILKPYMCPNVAMLDFQVLLPFAYGSVRVDFQPFVISKRRQNTGWMLRMKWGWL